MRCHVLGSSVLEQLVSSAGLYGWEQNKNHRGISDQIEVQRRTGKACNELCECTVLGEKVAINSKAKG